MTKVVTINGSPRMEKGNTALLLTPFLQGMTDAGADVELLYASRLQVKPCSCGHMYCWNEAPGECCLQDDMQSLYPRLKRADILVLAAPVYIPLPGAMQNVLNRLCPLLDPVLEFREGRSPRISATGTHAGQISPGRRDPQNRAGVHVWLVGDREFWDRGAHRPGAGCRRQRRVRRRSA